MKRSLLILGSLFAALVLVAYFLLQKRGEENISVDSFPLFVPIDSATVDHITIISPSSTIRVEKEGTDWFLKEPITYKADNSVVTSILHQLKELHVKSVVTSRSDKQSLFKVDSTGTHVTIFQNGSEEGSFYIGKAGPTYNDTYARKASSNDVVLVNAMLTYTFAKPVKEWRDKTIFSVPRENISGINYRYGDTTFTVLQTNGTWMIGNDSTKENVMTSLLASLSDVKADDFLDTTNAATIKTQAQISYGSGELHFAFDKTANKYYVQSSMSPQWFIMEPWKANQLLKRKKELLK
jgi:hypothetical protein